MTWIEVASDAVKIGLGALISLITTLIIAKRNIDSEAKKIFLTQKREKLDKCLSILNNFHKTYTNYRAEIHNFHIRKLNNQPMTESLNTDLMDKAESFRLAFEGFVDLEGYILAIGDLNAHAKLYEYMEVMDNAKDELWYDNTNITDDGINSINKKVRDARKQLFSALNKSYEPK